MPSSSKIDVHIFTDGAIRNNRRGVYSLAGSAAIAVKLKTMHNGVSDICGLDIWSEISEGDHVTNNWAEICGIKLAIYRALDYRHAAIWSDSKYAIGAISNLTWNLKNADHREVVKMIRGVIHEGRRHLYVESSQTPALSHPATRDVRPLGTIRLIHTKAEKHTKETGSWWKFFNALADLVAKHTVFTGSSFHCSFSEGEGSLRFTQFEQTLFGKMFRDLQKIPEEIID